MIHKTLFLSLLLNFSTFFCQEIDCEQYYNESKNYHEKLYGDIYDIDNSNLDKLIIESLDLKKIDKKNLILFYVHEYEYCPAGVPKQICKQFKPEEKFYEKLFTSRKLWSLDNILYFQKRIKKNIIPISSSGSLYSSLNSEYDTFGKIKFFKKGYSRMAPEIEIRRGIIKEFYYLPINNKKLELLQMVDYNYKDCNMIETIIEQKSSKNIQVKVIFVEDQNKNYELNFVYDNVEKWKLAK